MRSKMRKRTDTKTVTERRGQGTGGNRTEGGVDTSIEQGQGQAAVEKGEKRTEEGEAKTETEEKECG